MKAAQNEIKAAQNEMQATQFKMNAAQDEMKKSLKDILLLLKIKEIHKEEIKEEKKGDDNG